MNNRKGSIPFSNGSRGGGSFLSDVDALWGVCVLYVLIWHLMGSAGCRAARLKSQSAKDHLLQNARRHLLPPAGVAPLGSSVRPPFRLILLDYAGLNSVPCRSMACMMMARRRASAIRALRIVDRLAIAKAQCFSFNGPL